MEKPRPSAFVGSSAEGLTIAKAIQLNLDHPCEVTVWSQGVFGLSQGSLESLVARLNDFDFAILVVTPDDTTMSRGEVNQSPRDNILLELGMFIGALGRERTFLVSERGKPLKLPTDLAGVTLAEFEAHSDGNWPAALGAATTLIEGAIAKHGKKTPKITATIDDNTHFQILSTVLDASLLQFLIAMYETGKPMIRRKSWFDGGYSYEYRMGMGQAAGAGGFSVDDLCNKLPDAKLLQVNLRDEVTLTERGKDFAKWLVENGHKAEMFWSEYAQCGEGKLNFPGWDREKSIAEMLSARQRAMQGRQDAAQSGVQSSTATQPQLPQSNATAIEKNTSIKQTNRKQKRETKRPRKRPR